MNFFKLIESRRSIREFRQKSIPASLEKKILAAANLAPSAGNLQSYEIHVFHKRKKMAEAAGQEFIRRAKLILVFCANHHRSLVKYGRKKGSLYCIQDATIACTYAQLAAHSLGLTSTWVGAFDEQMVRSILGISSSEIPVAMLVIGYGKRGPANKRCRRELDDLVHKH